MGESGADPLPDDPLLPPAHGPLVARRAPGPRALPARCRRHRRAHRGRTRMTQPVTAPARQARAPGSGAGSGFRLGVGNRRAKGTGPTQGQRPALRRLDEAEPADPAAATADHPRRSTCTTPTACACRSSWPPPVSARAASARTSSRRAASRSTARSSPSSACASTRARQVVHVDGVRVNLDEDRVYLAFNKPKGVVTTMNDELGRISLADYVGNRERAALPRRAPRRRHRGPAAAHQRRRPRPPAPAPVATACSRPTSRRSAAPCSATSAGGCARASSSRTVRSRSTRSRSSTSQPGKAMVEVVLHEGRKHVVRRMLEAVGHPVESSCARRSARSGSPTSSPAARAGSTRPRSAPSTRPPGL